MSAAAGLFGFLAGAVSAGLAFSYKAFQDDENGFPKKAAVSNVQREKQVNLISNHVNQLNESRKIENPRKESSTSEEGTKDVIPFGFPGPTHDLLVRDGFTVCWDRRMRVPNWTFEHLTSTIVFPDETFNSETESNPEKSSHGRGSSFREDKDIPELYRSKLSDYNNSGWDRGHLVAKANLKHVGASDTFLLSNIVPQNPKLNRGYWANVEYFIRGLTRYYSDVYVFTGPLWLPRLNPSDKSKLQISYEQIGEVSVPTHFFKVILAAGSPTGEIGVSLRAKPECFVESFVIPNSNVPLDEPLVKFSTPLEAVEKACGLDFFPNLNKSSLLPLCHETSRVPCDLAAAHKFAQKLRKQWKKAKTQPETDEPSLESYDSDETIVQK